jgi:hypothetical protein
MARADRHFFGDLQIVRLLAEKPIFARQALRGLPPSEVV